MNSHEGVAQASVKVEKEGEEPPVSSFEEVGFDITNEHLAVYANASEMQVQNEATEIVPEGEKRIEATAQAMNISSEMLNETKQEFGLDTKLQEVQSEADLIVAETKSEIASVAGETESEQVSERKEKTPEELKAERRAAILNFKVDEKPTYEKRFQIPEETSLKERLKGVQYTMKDFQSQYPEALSFTMYGSMVKNTATLESDIDGTLFIDVTPTGNEESDAKVLANVESGQYLGKFKTELQNRLGLTSEQVGKDVKLETISENDVTNAAEIYLLSNELYKEEVKMWENSRRDTGKTEETIFGTRSVYEYDGEKPALPSVPNKISALFNLDIGGGIRKYREQFLNSLESLEPEQADDICRSISAYLSFSEGGKRNERTRLPHTFEDFKRTYLKL